MIKSFIPYWHKAWVWVVYIRSKFAFLKSIKIPCIFPWFNMPTKNCVPWMLWRPLVSNTSSNWSLMSRIQSRHKLSLILSSTPNSPPLRTWACQCLSSIQGLLPWALMSSPQILRDLRYIPPHLAPAAGGSTKNWSESHTLSNLQ